MHRQHLSFLVGWSLLLLLHIHVFYMIDARVDVGAFAFSTAPTKRGRSSSRSRALRSSNKHEAPMAKEPNTASTNHHSRDLVAVSSPFWPSAKQERSSSSASEDDNDDDDFLVHQERILDSIVQIHASHVMPNYIMPWQKQMQTTSSSTGFVIDPTTTAAMSAVDHESTSDSSKNTLRILTNAHSVEYASLVQVQKRGDSQKFTATVVHVSQECDLALLQIMDNAFWSNVGPLPLADDLPRLQQDVQVAGYPIGGDALSITSGVVSRMGLQEYAQSGKYLLAMQIDASINAGNSGGPVLDEDGAIVGVAFQSLENAENIGYVVPVSVVRHFLQQDAQEQQGFCAMGISLATLENDALRQWLRLDDACPGHETNGVMVTQIHTSQTMLERRDVILSIDGMVIAKDGKIPFRPPGERVPLLCYTQTKFVGETVRLDVFRQNEIVQLDVPVGLAPEFVPTHFDNRPPPYLILGGLVFTVLSTPYLVAVGAYEDYQNEQVSRLVALSKTAPQKERDEMVVLAQVLAHPTNTGYTHLADVTLDAVNGQPVRSLTHLHQVVSSSIDDDDPFWQLEFSPHERLVVLDRRSTDHVTQALCLEHSIPHPYYLFNDDESS